MIKLNRSKADEAPSSLQQMVLAFLAVLLLVFALGMVVGMTAAVIEHGVRNPLKLALAGTGALALLAGAARLLRRQARSLLADPVAPRIRRARWIMGILLALGAVAGIFLPHSDIGLGASGLAQGDLTPVTAIIMVAAWCIVAPLVTVLWWRNVDELEQAAYRDGAFWAVNLYAVVTPGWWLLWRAGLVGEPWHMAIFIGTMTVWTLVWLVRRYA